MFTTTDVKALPNLSYSALEPTPPFPREAGRWRLAGVLVPAVAVSLLTSSAMFMKMTTAGVGFGFFGDPLIWRGLDLLNKKIPNWQKYLELRQYVKTLIRVLMFTNIFKHAPQGYSYKCPADNYTPTYWRSEQSSTTSTTSLRRAPAIETRFTERRPRSSTGRVKRRNSRCHPQGPRRKGGRRTRCGK